MSNTHRKTHNSESVEDFAIVVTIEGLAIDTILVFEIQVEMANQNTADVKVQLLDQESWSEWSTRNDDQKTFKENLQEMMSMMLNCPLYGRGRDGSIYITVDNYIVDTIYANPSPLAI